MYKALIVYYIVYEPSSVKGNLVIVTTTDVFIILLGLSVVITPKDSKHDCFNVHLTEGSSCCLYCIHKEPECIPILLQMGSSKSAYYFLESLWFAYFSRYSNNRSKGLPWPFDCLYQQRYSFKSQSYKSGAINVPIVISRQSI